MAFDSLAIIFAVFWF